MLHPKLVVLILACDSRGRPNIMTAAWAMPVSSNPPLACVAISPRRYTYELIRESKEFTINVADVGMIREAHYCGTVSGRNVDKVSRLGLGLIPPSKINTPLLENALASLECSLYGEHEAGDHVLVLGRVLAAHARENFFHRTYDVSRARPLFHLGGDRYTTISGEELRP